MKKIIFSDYDGTLDTSENDINTNIKAINNFRENENLFVIATGRSYLDLKRKLDVYPIPFDYLILNHGGVILNNNEEVIDACLIPKDVALAILEALKSYNDIQKIVLFDIMQKDVKNVTDKLTKITIEMKDIISAKKISNYINMQYKNFVKSYTISTEKYNLVEIISIKTDKGKAIEKILELEKIADDMVYPIGDGSNDVEMIVKYNGYGMKKSEEAIYKVTNKLCSTVAELIQKIS